MAENEGRCVIEVAQVHCQFSHATYPDSTVQLFPSQIQVSSGGAPQLVIRLMAVRSIEVHQPLFGANYISGQYSEQDGSSSSFTMTFNKGGATDFARAFFRLTEGHLVTSEAPREPTQQREDKKSK